MNNIFKKTGSTIAKNREEVKKILSSYGINYGEGKNSDLVRASFKAIKEGNTDLAADLAGLMNKGKVPDFLNKVKNIKGNIREIVLKLRNKNSGNTIVSTNVSNADGSGSDPVSTDAIALIEAATSTDPDTATKLSIQEATIAAATISTVIILGLIIFFLFGADKLKLKI